MQVRDLMTERVIALQPNEDLANAHELMAENRIRHLPVVDSVGHLIGLVTHRDLVASALYSGDSLPISEMKELLRNTKVNEVMVTEIETLGPDTDISEAGMMMLENKFGCIPVVEGTTLVGILTESDFVRYVLSTNESESRGAA